MRKGRIVGIGNPLVWTVPVGHSIQSRAKVVRGYEAVFYQSGDPMIIEHFRQFFRSAGRWSRRPGLPGDIWTDRPRLCGIRLVRAPKPEGKGG